MSHMAIYKKRLCLFLFSALIILSLTLSMARIRQVQEDLAARLAPSILRFHILANSDSNADQQIKLEVRSLILDLIHSALSGENTNFSSKEATVDFLIQHRAQIEETAEVFLRSRGFSYPVQLEVTRDYFPAKAYDSYLFPCGFYDAARITLGAGRGHNWWCVLYPDFCFTDSVCQPVSEETKALLRGKLNQDDYLKLENHRPDVSIRFFLFPKLELPLPDGFPLPAPDSATARRPAAFGF